MNNIINKKNRFGKNKFFFSKIDELDENSSDKFKSILNPKKIEDIDQIYGGARYNNLYKNSIKEFPLFSIVMPNFKDNNLGKSIDSVLNQNYENVELIVIDGKSGDETIKLLKSYGDDIDLWVSEKDKNLWDAWNKGFTLARGSFVGIVDSSNILYPNALEILKKYIKHDSKIDFICGTIKKDNKVYAGYRPEDIYRQFNIIPSTVVGFYIKLNSLKKVGLLNTNYRFQSDYDWLYRIVVSHKLKGIRTKSEEIFGDLGKSNFSTKFSFFSVLINELKIRLNNKQNFLIIIFIFFGRILVKNFRSIMSFVKIKK